MAVQGKKFSEFPEAKSGEVIVVGLQDGKNVKLRLTTDRVATNPDIIYRDAKGRFKSTADLPKLENSLDNFRFIATTLDAQDVEIKNMDGRLATVEEVIQALTGADLEGLAYDDTEVRDLIAAEEKARAEADAAIIEAMEGYNPDVGGLESALAQEVKDRESGDNALGELVSLNASELNSQAQDIDKLAGAIRAEESDRKSGDAAIQDLLVEAQEALEDADADLQEQIDAINDVGYDDSELREALAIETDAREKADSSLQNQIDAINESGYDDTELKAKVTANREDIDAHDETIGDHAKQLKDLWFANATQRDEIDDLVKVDEGLQNQINKLAADLETIEELVESFVYEITEQQPAAGFCQFANPGQGYRQQRTIYLGSEDMYGSDTTLPYEIGDRLRFEEPDDQAYALVTIAAIDQERRRIDFGVDAAKGAPTPGKHLRILLASDDLSVGGEMDWDTADARYAMKEHSHPLYAAVSHTHPDYAKEDHDHDGYLKADGSVKGVSVIQAPAFATGSLKFDAEYAYPSIVEKTATRIEFEGRTIIRKGDTLDAVGLEIRGKTLAGSNKNLLEAYHVRSGVDSIRYYGSQVADEDVATVGYVDDQFLKRDADLAAPPIVHLMGKGQWGRNEIDVATDKFIATKADGTYYGNLNQYVRGIMVAQQYGGQYTNGLTWQQGAHLEIYDNDGYLIFAAQIDSSESSSRNYLHLKFDRAPSIYQTFNNGHSYGDNLWLKVHGLTGEVRYT